MNSDFSELLNLFNANNVKYLSVGGYAVMLYTEPRYTKDLDIWIEANEENAARAFRALAEFGAPLAGLAAADFSKEGFFYQLGRPPARIDIQMSQEAPLGGRTAWFISRSDLIKNKRATGRHIDLHDVEQLDS